MDKEIRNKDLRSLGEHRRYGVALKDWLEENLAILTDINDIKTLDEVLGKQYAVRFIKKLFKFLKKEEKIKQRTNQYK